jgi:hypothetical protein
MDKTETGLPVNRTMPAEFRLIRTVDRPTFVSHSKFRILVPFFNMRLSGHLCKK